MILGTQNPLSLQLEHDGFLENILERPSFTARLQGANRKPWNQLFSDLPSDTFCTARVGVDDLKTTHALEMEHFQWIDTNVTLEKQGDFENPSSPGFIRPAEKTDEPYLIQWAPALFHQSRFHRDPLIGIEAANRIKAAWISNFFFGRRGQGMLVYEQAAQPIGFLLWLTSPQNFIVIDLIAVHPQWKGRGIGTDLVAALHARVSQSRNIRVGTQIGNFDSLAFYQKLGFRIVEAQNIFHFHKELEGSHAH